ncbi:hypothetical protein CANCADRAFT_46229 [Tortispora caseinolytica NRRL Y-17796]|uniref:AB hydrolase-1 domain-containing protein n=1 Tax=Tortispora caseinolytica NRRL Y-17796 TaxID=767744 RepID=A0A1E4T9E2_9ASCO|nr:hypothetical protein CANCADRAFT_46229 [Tortispora caseinolytica NRRL Y-17796]
MEFIERIDNNSDDSNHTCLVMVPGNPGLAGFYRPFMESLAKERPDLDYLCISHAAGKKIFQLDEEIDYLSERILRKLPTKNVVLCGHSIGSYMAIRIALKLADRGVHVRNTFLLMPTITDLALSNAGTKLSAVSKVPGMQAVLPAVFSGFASFLAVLPASTVYPIIRWVVQGTDSAVNTVYQLVTSPYAARQAIGMAWDELDKLVTNSELQPERFWTEFGSSVHVLFADNDKWVNPSTEAKVVKHVLSMGASEPVHESVSHSFCINEKDSATVARFILDRL